MRTLKGDTRHDHITNTSQTINMNPKHQVKDTIDDDDSSYHGLDWLYFMVFVSCLSAALPSKVKKTKQNETKQNIL